MEGTQGKECKGELLHVDPETIKQSPSQLREVDKKSERYQQILASLALPSGLINPISVRRERNKETNRDELILVDGAHRLAATKEYGFITVPVHVLSLTEMEAAAAQVIANMAKQETKPYQYARQMLRLMSYDPSITVADLAQKISRTVPYVKQLMGLDKLQPAIGELVDKKALDLSVGLAISKLSPEFQADWAEKALLASADKTSGEIVEAIKSWDRDRKAKIRQGIDPSTVTFVAEPKLRQYREIKDEYATGTVGKEIVDPSMDPVEAFKLGIGWTIQMDEESIKKREDAFNTKRTAEEEKLKKQKEAAQQRILEKKQKEVEALKKKQEIADLAASVPTVASTEEW